MEFYLHNITKKDINEIVKTLNTPFLTTGPVTTKFEKKLSNFLNVKETVGVNSCTAALHLSLLASDVGPGDEVITTPLSFVATANAILHTGATPVFVDVDSKTGNINPKLIEKAITKKTKAIVPVHLYGVLCDMKKIYKIAKKHNLKIITDCAHALESVRDNYNSAAYSDFSCYSFYATKNLASGEGGAIALNSSEDSDRLKKLRLHGMDKSAADRYITKYKHYDVTEVGWKYNMDDIHASLLINQLDRIKKYQDKRIELYNKYIDEIKNINNISVPKIPKNTVSAHHLFVIKVKNYKNRDKYLAQLQDNGIPVAVNFNPIHLMSVYKKMFGFKQGDFPISEKFGASVITLPFYVKLKQKNFKKIISTLKKIFN